MAAGGRGLPLCGQAPSKFVSVGVELQPEHGVSWGVLKLVHHLVSSFFSGLALVILLYVCILSSLTAGLVGLMATVALTVILIWKMPKWMVHVIYVL